MKSLACFLLNLFLCVSVFATADGPDYFRLKGDSAIALQADNSLEAEILLQIPAQTDGLRNLGCKGLPGFSEWTQMSEDDRLAAKARAWCKVEYLQVAGWIPQKYLEEGAHPSPSFDCSQAEGEVENLICQEPSLMVMDNHLYYVYRAALTRAGDLDVGPEEAVNLLKATQRGWIKGRNDCWKSSERIANCVEQAYARRIAELQVQWMLVPARETHRYTCGSDSHEFTLTFFDTETLAGAALEYSDNREVLIVTPTASGVKYAGKFGRYVWIKGDEALFVWEQDKDPINCVKDNSVSGS